MHMYIQWDESKRRRNLREHGVDFAGLVSFFEGEILTHEDVRYPYREHRYQSVGMAQQTVLFVVWTPGDAYGMTIRLISARKATENEAQAWFSYYATRH
jgi:uncharacterized protein